MPYDCAVVNATIVTINPDFDIIHNGYIAIASGRIQQIECQDPDHPPPEALEVIDASGCVVMPGFVNAHTHLPMSLFRGMADDLPLDVWLNDYMFPMEAKTITSSSVHYGTLLACAEMLLGGTTTCCDGYFYEEAVATAVSAAGMRAVLAQGVIDFPAPGVPDPQHNIATAEAFVSKWRSTTPLIRPSIFCHSAYTCSPATLQAAKAAARREGVLFQIHTAETKDEITKIADTQAATPIQHLENLDLLDPYTLLIHCVWATPEDTARLAHHNVNIAHCPESNMKLASGVAPVPRLLEAGLTVALGTDGCASNNNLDMFREMDMTAKLHKVCNGDPTVSAAATVLKMATINGARAIGLDSEVGSLEEGKAADLIVVDFNKPHLVPCYHPVSHLVYTAGKQDVRDVLVAGNLLVRNRQLQTLDLDEVVAGVNRLCDPIRKELSHHGAFRTNPSGQR